MTVPFAGIVKGFVRLTVKKFQYLRNISNNLFNVGLIFDVRATNDILEFSLCT